MGIPQMVSAHLRRNRRSPPTGVNGTGTPGQSPAPVTKPVDLEVTVRECNHAQLDAGCLRRRRGLGGVLDVSDLQHAGSRARIGLRSRYDTTASWGRVYFRTALAAHVEGENRRERLYQPRRDPATSLSGVFTIDRIGASISQERELRNHYVWNYGFRYGVRTPFDVSGARDERCEGLAADDAFTRNPRRHPGFSQGVPSRLHSFSYASRDGWCRCVRPSSENRPLSSATCRCQPGTAQSRPTNRFSSRVLVYAFGDAIGDGLAGWAVPLPSSNASLRVEARACAASRAERCWSTCCWRGGGRCRVTHHQQ